MQDDALDDKIKKLNFSIEMSMRYHQRRRAFYERNHNVIMFLIVICGSTAFSGLAVYSVPVATVLAAFDLVWKPSHRSRDHEVLFRRFSDLVVDVRTGDQNEGNYGKWKKKRITIEADEPPVYWVLADDCHNEVTRLTKTPWDLVKIPWWRRLTMNWLRYFGRSQEPAVSSARQDVTGASGVS